MDKGYLSSFVQRQALQELLFRGKWPQGSEKLAGA